MKKYYLIIFIFLLIIILLSCVNLFVFNKNKQIFSEITEEKQKELVIQKEEEYLENLSKILKNNSELISQIKEAMISDKEEKDFMGFVNFLENFLAQNKIEAKVLFDRKTEDSLIFRISFTSSFENGFVFLKKIEQIPYFLRIEKIQILPSLDKNSLNFDITISVLRK